MAEVHTSAGAVVDVVVVGGGVAGLSGALTLARARRSVVVLDAGEPRNAPAEGVHGLLAREGMAPGALLAAGAAEVVGYGGRVERDPAVSVRAVTGGGFVVTAASGVELAARRLLVSTGLVDELPDVPGLRTRWGRDVLHCPYCHGWEIRDRRVAVLATGPGAVHQALLFRQWTPALTLLRHTAPDLDDEQSEQLAARGVEVVDGEVTGLEVTDDRLTGVTVAGGHRVAAEVLVVGPRFVAAGEILDGLGLVPTPHPWGVGTFVAADASGATAVPGVWVAGNVTDLMAGVAVAAGQGVTAAAAINGDLVAEDTRLAVARRSGRAEHASASGSPR